MKKSEDGKWINSKHLVWIAGIDGVTGEYKPMQRMGGKLQENEPCWDKWGPCAAACRQKNKALVTERISEKIQTIA